MTEIELGTWLIQEGFPPDSVSGGYSATLAKAMTPLMHAARLGAAEVVRAMPMAMAPCGLPASRIAKPAWPTSSPPPRPWTTRTSTAPAP